MLAITSVTSLGWIFGITSAHFQEPGLIITFLVVHLALAMMILGLRCFMDEQVRFALIAVKVEALDPVFFRFFSAPSPSTSTLEIQVKVSLRRLANRDKEYETSASGRRSAGIMSALSRKSTQVGPQNAIVIDEAVRITPVEQSTASAAVAASDDSPTPTTKERPRSNILKDT